MRKLSLALALIYALVLSAQVPPAIEWQQITWDQNDITGNPQTQSQSADEWWYSHKNLYTGALQTGYVTVGYNASLFDNTTLSYAQAIFSEINSCYNLYQTPPNFTLPVDCSEMEKYGVRRSQFRGNVSISDLNGNIQWNKSICIGDLQEVIQDGNFIYVVGNHHAAKSLDKTVFLNYNPSSSSPNDNFDMSSPVNFGVACSTNVGLAHIYVAKLDLSGNIIWQNIYGIDDYSTNKYGALNSQCIGYDLIKNSDGNLYVVGQGQTVPGNSTPASAVVLKLDPSNGYVLNKTTLPISGLQNSFSYPIFEMGAKSIVEIGSTGKMAIACSGFFDSPSSYGFVDWHRAFIYCIDQNLNLNTAWGTNPISFASTGGNKRSNIWEIKYHAFKNELLAPVISDCINCAFAGNNQGQGNIFRVDPSNGSLLSVSAGPNPASFGAVHGFDLRIGVEETADNGFVAVSTTSGSPSTDPTTYPPSTADLGYLDTQTTNSQCNTPVSAGFAWWNTDPIVAKFDVNSNLKWTKKFDVIPGRLRQPPPGDLKLQECVYKISQTQDGGYVVSGNTSYNFDDNYFFKLYADCNAQAAYDIQDPSNVITLAPPTTLWNTPHKVIGQVVVPSGKTLIIDNTTVEFADSKLTGVTTNITVQPGGRLIIRNNALLTSIQSCPNSMWDGVDVLGTSLSQTSGNQGTVVMNSNGAITNARIALEMGSSANALISVNGGIVNATSARFENNYKDVQMYRYAAPLTLLGNEPDNISFFEGCSFLGTALLNDPTYKDALGNRITNSIHVDLYGVKNIKFTNNLFKTNIGTLPAGYLTANRGIGINANSASFITTPRCLAMDPYGNCVYGPPNNFENLRYGVFAQSPNPMTGQFTVKKTNFTNCYSSIYHSGINYCKVEQNNFLINTTIPSIGGRGCTFNPISCTNYFYYATNSSGFSHQDNNYTVVGSQNVVATIFNGCGTAANESYRNFYNNCYTGHQHQLTNGSTAVGMNGLQIKCNTNTANKKYDILQTSGIMGEQAACITSDLKSPANNIFTQLSQVNKSDINAYAGGGFKYNFPGTPAGGNQDPNLYVTSNIIPLGCGVTSFVYNDQTCPDKLVYTNVTGPPNASTARENALVYQHTADQLKQPLVAGASQNLLNAIQSNMGEGQLRNLLIQYSPYLSDAVLIAYLHRNPQPVPGMIKDVIIANSPVTGSVYQELQSLNLPEGTMNLINDVQTGTSAREQLEKQVAYYVYLKNLTVNEIIRNYLEDVTVNQLENIEYWLGWKNTIDAKRDLIFVKLARGEFDGAQQLIFELNSLEGGPSYLDYVQVYKNLYMNNQTLAELRTNANYREKTERVADDPESPLMSNALTALITAFEEFKDHIDPPSWDDEEYADIQSYEVVESINGVPGARIKQTKEIAQKKNLQAAESDRILASAYPNPFSDKLWVSYKLNDSRQGTVDITLFEIASGRLIAKLQSEKNSDLLSFDANTLASGVYVVTIKQNGETLSNIKIVNIK